MGGRMTSRDQLRLIGTCTLGANRRTGSWFREAGESPAQSRYGDQPLSAGSPVAGPTVVLVPSREREDTHGPSTTGPLRRATQGSRMPGLSRLAIARSVRPLQVAGPASSRPPRRRPPSLPPTVAPNPTSHRATVAPTRPSPDTPAPIRPVRGRGLPGHLIDDEGTEVTLESEPERIVSLSPANTEIVFALGDGRPAGRWHRLRRLSRPRRPVTPDVVDVHRASIMEQVVDARARPRARRRQQLHPACRHRAAARRSGIPVIVVYAETVDEVLADIQLIGDALGRRRRGRTIVDRRCRRDIDEVDRRRRGDHGTPAYVLRDRLRRPRSTGPRRDSFMADMVELAGGEPITTGDPAVFSIPLEQLVAADPEVIVLGDALYGVCPEPSPARPGWDDHDRRRERRRPAGQRHRRHAAGAAARRGPGVARARDPPELDARRRLESRRRAARRPVRPPSAEAAASRPTLARAALAAPRTGWLAAARRRPLAVRGRPGRCSSSAVLLGIALRHVSRAARRHARRSSATGCWAGRSASPGRPPSETIVLELRLPRVLTAMVVGIGLAVAGATFQGLLRNPLADPYVLGTASGAALGAAIGGAAAGPGRVARVRAASTLLAFAGALIAVALVYRLSRGRAAGVDDVGAADRLRGRVAARGRPGHGDVSRRASNLRQIFFYLLGSFSQASWEQLAVGAADHPRRHACCIVARARAAERAAAGRRGGRPPGRRRAPRAGDPAGAGDAGDRGRGGAGGPDRLRRARRARTWCGCVVGPNARLVLPLSALVRRGVPGARRPRSRASRARSRSASSRRSSGRRCSCCCCAGTGRRTSCERAARAARVSAWRTAAGGARRRRPVDRRRRAGLPAGPQRGGQVDACCGASPGSCAASRGACCSTASRSTELGRRALARRMAVVPGQVATAVRDARRGGRRARSDAPRAPVARPAARRPRRGRRRDRAGSGSAICAAATRASCRSASASWCCWRMALAQARPAADPRRADGAPRPRATRWR